MALRFAHHAPALLFLVAALTAPVAGQLDDEDEDDPLRPGLITTFSNGTSELRRVDSRLAFRENDHFPDARFSGPDSRVRWQGYLLSQAPGEYQLSVYACGKFTLRLRGKVLLEAETREAQWHVAQPQQLPYGWHLLEVDFRKTAGAARIGLFWSGPGFALEPIGPRQFFHDRGQTPDVLHERGRELVRALRCGGCHDLAGGQTPVPGPALDRLGGNVDRRWLTEWLTDAASEHPERRMPHFRLSAHDARDITSYLLSLSPPAKDRPYPRGDTEVGRDIFLKVGCLACHQLGALGSSPPLGGGDLTRIGAKRPAGFFVQWLADPSSLNRDHRMPRFELADEERGDLAAFLASCVPSATRLDSPVAHAPAEADDDVESSAAAIDRGQQLVVNLRCAVCHTIATSRRESAQVPIAREPNWVDSCLQAPARRRPGYRLPREDVLAVQAFVSLSLAGRAVDGPQEAGWQLLQDYHCLACHTRDESPGLLATARQLTRVYPEFAAQLPAMLPPSLSSVGDKLHRSALIEAITNGGGVRRPWLAVRMPRFRLDSDQVAMLARYFIDEDRIPDGHPARRAVVPSRVSPAIAARLVTADGFGCTSCHAIGTAKPPLAPLGTQGPDLAGLSSRIRRTWFDRWVRNPARITERMEMPSVQVPIKGVLGDQLDDQLAAVWGVLNQPGFDPPEPNPVRVVRRSGVADASEQAAVLTDVLRLDDRRFIKPFLVGLPNRHNVLVDLETNRLAGWWMGDVARQRTEGKSWFWEAAADLLGNRARDGDIQIVHNADALAPLYVGQFRTEPDAWEHTQGGVRLRHRLHYAGDSRENTVVHVVQSFLPLPASADDGAGWQRTVRLQGIPQANDVVLRVVDSEQMRDWQVSQDQRSVRSAQQGLAILLRKPEDAIIGSRGDVVSAARSQDAPVEFQLEYRCELPVDQFPAAADPVMLAQPRMLDVVPGFEATRLGVAAEIMPTAFTWRPDGTLVVASLKGRVWLCRDVDGDELEDVAVPVGDELAAPFGLHAGAGHIDVINKHGLLRLHDADGGDRVQRTQLLASGWGHTDDYHDWAVGLPRDEAGSYYVAIACQQDRRTDSAARLRGKVIELRPRRPTANNPRQYEIHEISGGHRFPMGIARNREGELFVTDNQGNYNPFNELNHVVRGARYGFINARERRPGFDPPLTPPAIDIPHPWTRSVNGICFLETPAALRQKGRTHFGPFEGHLIGCEYDTRRLIRLSLERVGGAIQGAAYPLSLYHGDGGETFLGPLTCAVAPDGDVYVGCVRDSGWGGANNTGEIVRLRPRWEELPAGIAEVRATPRGFQIAFTRPVDRRRASQASSYAVSSYRRVSTPDYGGPDVDRRTDRVVAVAIDSEARVADIELDHVRAGCVYELRVSDLAPDGARFHPAEAYYTLGRVPAAEP